MICCSAILFTVSGLRQALPRCLINCADDFLRIACVQIGSAERVQLDNTKTVCGFANVEHIYILRRFEFSGHRRRKVPRLTLRIVSERAAAVGTIRGTRDDSSPNDHVAPFASDRLNRCNDDWY